MKRITLGGRKGKGKYVLVDDIDFDYINQFKWSLWDSPNSKYEYAQARIKIDGKPKMIRMHRMIMNASVEMEIDHVNGDGLDNRKENLRPATKSQNAMNRKLEIRNKSGYKGVCWRKDSKKWTTRIKINQKQISLGCYDDIKEAALAYNKAATHHFKEFAHLNEL